MNYEEKYNNAIESIKRIYNQADSYGRELMEKEFPELRESKDERIRKGLVKGLSAMRDIHHHQTFSDDAINIDDAIACLEKQDKQKPTPKYKTGDCIKYRGEKYKITNVTITDNNFYYNVSLIKEPSDWGEVVAAIGMAAEEKMFKIEQEPSWGEEDEKMFDKLYEILYRYGYSSHPEIDLSSNEAINLISWLKSLKPQSHWKPSEEQMEALFEAKLASIKNREYYLGLLYEDLKKL